MFGFPRGRRRSGGALPDAPVTLFPLALSSNSIPENSVAGTIVGAILGQTAGSALVLTNDAGSRFAISGGNLVAGATSTDYETATSHAIAITETKAGAVGSPKVTNLTVNVTDVAETLSLAIVTAPAIAGDMVVGQRLFAVRGSYSQVPDSFTNEWFLDAALISDALADNLLVLDIYAGKTITFGEVAHKAGYADSPLNMAP